MDFYWMHRFSDTVYRFIPTQLTLTLMLPRIVYTIVHYGSHVNSILRQLTEHLDIEHLNIGSMSAAAWLIYGRRPKCSIDCNRLQILSVAD